MNPADIFERMPSHMRRPFITGAVVLLALFLAGALWWHYFRSPWTRDGRVRVEVVTIAAQISGEITALSVKDNQRVKKGDELFKIESVDYELALKQAEAAVQSRQFQAQIAQEDAERRANLGAQAISAEEKNTARSSFQQSQSAYASSVAVRDQAKINLQRCIIRSPVNGYVTNLTLRVGDYATPGQTKLSVVDSDSFWVSGYFEETKLPRIRKNDFAHVRLMGWGPEIVGHVESISRGISDTNADVDSTGLQNVNPIFTWVRLAQRIPVRIHIDKIPDKIVIAAGQTCTIQIDDDRQIKSAR